MASGTSRQCRASIAFFAIWIGYVVGKRRIRHELAEQLTEAFRERGRVGAVVNEFTSKSHDGTEY